MKRLLIALPLVLFFLATTANAFLPANTDGFHKRFKVVKNDAGEVVAIKKRIIGKQFSVWPFVEQIRRDIKFHISRVKNKDVEYIGQMEELLYELEETVPKSDEEDNVQRLRESLYGLADVDIDSVLNDPRVKGVFGEFGQKLKEYLRSFSLTTMARLDTPRFYYRRAVTYKAVEFGLKIAKKRLSSVPVLNTIFYVLVRIDKLLREKRIFNQNILLHYFETFDPSEFGMTKEEVDFAVSSIYESKIPYINYWESNNAVANWPSYGFTSFYRNYRAANAKLRKYHYVYERVGERLNFAFSDVIVKGQKRIVNLFDTKHMFSKKPHVAYIYDKPRQVYMLRSLMRLGQIGLSFLPIGGWIKDNVDKFINSFYYKQKITEGSLVAYFESIGNQNMVEQIKLQNINPYLD